jgi:hypothetical protein
VAQGKNKNVLKENKKMWIQQNNGIETPNGVYVPKEGETFKEAIFSAMRFGGMTECRLIIDDSEVASESDMRTPTRSAKIARPADKAGCTFAL